MKRVREKNEPSRVAGLVLGAVVDDISKQKSDGDGELIETDDKASN